MAIVVATMTVIVFVAAAVLAFVGALHVASTSPRFRARLRRWTFATAAGLCVARRAARRKLAPALARLRERLRSRAAGAQVAEMESAGQQ